MPILALALGMVALPALSQPPAFPGAQGAGAYALGGRGGDVYYVTTLADTGTGSLRTGISTAPTTGRTILFKVSGNIALKSTLTINHPRITIAGQTAPGDGICLQDYSFNIAANDVVVRHVRTRLGTNALQEADAMWINGGTNIIVDHLSASWSVDETLSASRSVANLTVQNCYITESLQNSIHSKGAHGYGGLISSASSVTYSYLRNLYAHHDSRSPRVGSDSQAGTLRLDFRNNLIYDWGFRAGYTGSTNENTEINYVNNYLVAGPASTSTTAFLGGGSTTGFYQSGNLNDTDKDGRVDGVDTGWAMITGVYTRTNAAYPVPVTQTETAGAAYQRILAQSGAMPWRRDATDQRVVRSVRFQRGTLVDFIGASNQTADYVTNSIGGTNYIGVRGWPVLASETAPVDTDGDGMPDYWELVFGLNPTLASDRNLTNPVSGYTRLEEYLNWLGEPHALWGRNGPVEVDLCALNGNSTNLTFAVANATNGAVTLLADGHTARFVPQVDFSGLAGFTFTALEATNGLGFGPVSVGVLITTTNAPNANRPPVLATVTNASVMAGGRLAFTCIATDSPQQTLSFTLEGAPGGAVIGTNTGAFEWRPPVAQGGSTNRFAILVTDDGQPVMAATQQVAVAVLRPVRPWLNQSPVNGGRLTLSVGGDAGPDYTIQVSTDLRNWDSRFTTNSPALPFVWTDPEPADQPRRFYRALLGP